nr:hypothetical protein [Bacillus sp. S1-R5C1-FB]
MKKKSYKPKRKCPRVYLTMYGIHNWCSIRAAALGELEGQEASLKNKARPKYVSLENAVMRRVIDNRKTKSPQKDKTISTHTDQMVPSERAELKK